MKIFSIAILLSLVACNLFEKEETSLAEHVCSDGKKVNIYYVGLGATTNDVIQVKKSGYDNPFWVSEKYNYLKSSSLLNDTTLQLILTDTGYHNYNNKLDTIIVKLK